MSDKITKSDNHLEDISICLSKIDLPAKKGVIHVGAHKGEEVPEYFRNGYENIILIEANPMLCQEMKHRFQDNRVRVLNYAVTDRLGFVEFYIHKSSKGSLEPSSILKMKEFNKIVSTLVTSEVIRVPCTSLNDFFKAEKIDPNDYNLLVLDIQGAEYLALLGASKVLRYFEAIICEVVCLELYEGSVKEEEIDKLITSHGFNRIFTIYHELYRDTEAFPAWGEAVYLSNASSNAF